MLDKQNYPLFDLSAIKYLLSVLMKEPKILIEEEQYILTTNDFDIGIYATIFAVIHNMAQVGVSRILPQDIDLYLKQYPQLYSEYCDKDGYELTVMLNDFVTDYEMAKFDIYYEKTKKFTVLRELKANGFSVKEFYEETDFLNKEEKEKHFNSLTVKDILNRVRNKIQLVENKNVNEINAESAPSWYGMRNLYENLKQTPDVGEPLNGDIFNYCVRGARKGKFYLYSGNSGAGKSRTMLGNACCMSLPQIIDGKLIRRSDLKKALFVPTEMNLEEIQTLILAFVSGISEEKILYGNCTEDEEKIIYNAIQIIEEYGDNLIIDRASDTSIKGIKSKITNHIIKDNTEYIFLDYIFSSVGLIEESQRLRLREDVVLMMLSNTLKEIAVDYNVFMMSGTQITGEHNKPCFRDASFIRGSKAIADKADVGMIGVKICQEELEKIEQYLNNFNLIKPNLVIDLYKNRRGKMADVKLFRYFDYTTCRTKDIIATTRDYELITDIIKIEYETITKDLRII